MTRSTFMSAFQIFDEKADQQNLDQHSLRGEGWTLGVAAARIAANLKRRTRLLKGNQQPGSKSPAYWVHG